MFVPLPPITQLISTKVVCGIPSRPIGSTILSGIRGISLRAPRRAAERKYYRNNYFIALNSVIKPDMTKIDLTSTNVTRGVILAFLKNIAH